MRFFEPFREMEALRREIDRAFEGALASRKHPRLVFLPGQSARSYPMINVHQDADVVTVEALAPGVRPDSLDIQVHGNTLKISGEKSGPQGVAREQYHRSERSAGRFVRTVTLPSEIDNDSVRADYKQGILTVVLPKSAAAKPRQVSVAVN